MADVGPFKCPDCGTWWAAPYEHHCPPMQGVLSIYPSGGNVRVGNIPVRCTCPPDRGDNYAGSCPIHDVQSTYTVRVGVLSNRPKVWID